jgi:hypothetical protein
MTMSDRFNRRDLFVKLGLLFNGAVGVLLGVPVVRYLLSPVVRGRQGGTNRGCRWDRSPSTRQGRHDWPPTGIRW